MRPSYRSAATASTTPFHRRASSVCSGSGESVSIQRFMLIQLKLKHQEAKPLGGGGEMPREQTDKGADQIQQCLNPLEDAGRRRGPITRSHVSHELHAQFSMTRTYHHAVVILPNKATTVELKVRTSTQLSVFGRSLQLRPWKPIIL